jgi:hypothetical protein
MLYFTLLLTAAFVRLSEWFLHKVGIFSLHLCLSVVFTYALVSLVEYLSHRFLQHTRAVAKRFPRSALLEKIFIDHAKVHHHDAYDIFNDEPNPRWRLYNLVIKYRTTVAVMVVFGIPLYALDHFTAIVFWLGVVLHNTVWSAVHIEMHLNQGHLIRRTPFFEYWEQYHFLHHIYPGKNFNALFPLWDWIFGTFARADKDDLRALEATRQLKAVSRRAFLTAKYAGRHLDWLQTDR